MNDDASPQKFSAHAVVALATGVAAISTGAVLIRLADAPPLVIAAYRVGIATLILFPAALLTARRELAALTASDLRWGLLAGLFLALHFAAWVTSVKYTSVAASVLLVNTSPVWVGIFAPLATGEKTRPMIYLSILLSVLGAFVIGVEDYGTGVRALKGDLLALAGGVCAAGYLLMGRRLRRKLSLTAYITVCYGSAALILWLLVFAEGLPVLGFSRQTAAAFLAMAIFPQLIGHSCYNWALKYFSTGFVAVSLLGEPIGSTLLAYIIFGESLSVMKVAGAVVILAAIYLAAVSEKR